MKFLLKIPALLFSLSLAACAGNHTAVSTSNDDYVEVDNPYITMAPDAPKKIWVPRSSVENGPPRGSDLLKKGASQVSKSVGGPGSGSHQAGSAQQEAPPVTQTSETPQHAAQHPAASAPLPPEALPTPKKRIALLELGQNGLAKPLYESLLRTTTETVLDPAQTAIQSDGKVTEQTGKGAIAKRLAAASNANILAFVSSPEGVGPGKYITAEIYDTIGGGLLKRFDALIPQYSESDKNARETAVAAASGTIGNKIKELIAFILGTDG